MKRLLVMLVAFLVLSGCAGRRIRQSVIGSITQQGSIGWEHKVISILLDNETKNYCSLSLVYKTGILANELYPYLTIAPLSTFVIDQNELHGPFRWYSSCKTQFTLLDNRGNFLIHRGEKAK